MGAVYVPAHFAASEQQVNALLGSGPALDLITVGPDGMVATVLPMLHDPAAGTLTGHVARNNPHWQVARDSGVESLAIARGPDAYVSPSWYASKAEHGRVVPTWNYLSVQLQGRLVVHEDPDWLRALVTRLTEQHEQRIGSGWQVSDAPEPFVSGQLRAIVGLELVISRIEAKAKFSQNRPAADQDGVVAALDDGSPADRAVAAAMRAVREG